MRLTDLQIQRIATPEHGQKSYRDDTLPGFACRVSQGGTKTFVLMHGKDRRLTTIGRYPIISLQDARTEAKRLLAEATLGKHRPKRQTFGDSVETFLQTHVAEKQRPGTASETKRILQKQFKSLHGKQLSDISTDDITRIIDRFLASDLPSAASHAFTCVRTFLKWCVRRSYIPHSPIEALERPTKLTSRERVLSDDELRVVWKAAETIGGNFGKITQLLILTGQRRSEIGSLQTSWCSLGGEEVDIPHSRYGARVVIRDRPSTNDLPSQSATICIPSDFTKNKRSHTFPIGQLASELLSSSLCSAAIIFPARGKPSQPFNGWSKAKAQLDRKISELRQNYDNSTTIPWTLHDLRRTYATNLQRLGIKLEIIEALLNHVSGTRAGIVGVYNRHRYEAEMREAVNAFEGWFTKVILSA